MLSLEEQADSAGMGLVASALPNASAPPCPVTALPYDMQQRWHCSGRQAWHLWKPAELPACAQYCNLSLTDAATSIEGGGGWAWWGRRGVGWGFSGWTHQRCLFPFHHPTPHVHLHC